MKIRASERTNSVAIAMKPGEIVSAIGRAAFIPIVCARFLGIHLRIVPLRLGQREAGASGLSPVTQGDFIGAAQRGGRNQAAPFGAAAEIRIANGLTLQP